MRIVFGGTGVDEHVGSVGRRKPRLFLRLPFFFAQNLPAQVQSVFFAQRLQPQKLRRVGFAVRSDKKRADFVAGGAGGGKR